MTSRRRNRNKNNIITAGTLAAIAAIITSVAALWPYIFPPSPPSPITYDKATVDGTVVYEKDKPVKRSDVVLDNSAKSKTDDAGGFLFVDVPTNKRHDLTVYDSGSITFWKQFFITNNKNTFTLSVLQVGAVAPQTSAPVRAINVTDLPTAAANRSLPKVQFTRSLIQATYNISLAQKGEEIPKVALKPGSNPFKFTFWIVANPETLARIDRVSYYLHPTFNPQVVTKVSAKDNFSLSFNGWGKFDLKAKVYFKNGQVRDLVYPADKWTIDTELIAKDMTIRTDMKP